jgi:hypothetical protein
MEPFNLRWRSEGVSWDPMNHAAFYLLRSLHQAWIFMAIYLSSFLHHTNTAPHRTAPTRSRNNV